MDIFVGSYNSLGSKGHLKTFSISLDVYERDLTKKLSILLGATAPLRTTKYKKLRMHDWLNLYMQLKMSQIYPFRRAFLNAAENK